MKKVTLLALFSVLFYFSNAQSHKYQSVFIYTFTKYVIWPEAYNEGDFEILVLGDCPILAELQDMATLKKVSGTRPIKVTKIKSFSEIRKCNILFVPANQSTQIADVVSKVANQSILIVTEEPGLGAKGSSINFIVKDGKLAFELNQSAISKQNLKIANELTRLAILI
jgi:hypothetical protein